jgi:hypothetical protein
LTNGAEGHRIVEAQQQAIPVSQMLLRDRCVSAIVPAANENKDRVIRSRPAQGNVGDGGPGTAYDRFLRDSRSPCAFLPLPHLGDSKDWFRHRRLAGLAV